MECVSLGENERHLRVWYDRISIAKFTTAMMIRTRNACPGVYSIFSYEDEKMETRRRGKRKKEEERKKDKDVPNSS